MAFWCCLILPLVCVTLVSLSGAAPTTPNPFTTTTTTKNSVTTAQSPFTTSTQKTNGSDLSSQDEVKCLEDAGDSFPPLNLYSEELESAEDEDDDEDAEKKIEWKKIKVNRYYGVLRDRFYVRNKEGFISIQLRDGEPTSAATLLGTEDDWSEEYVLAKADIYYSQGKHYGSQHAIRGETYAFEIQFVHYRKDQGSLRAAAGVKHGILVLCVLFESTGKQNPYMDPLVSAAIMSVFPSEKLHVAHGPLDIKALLPSDMSSIQYTGTYVGDPCSKQAKFVVLISNRQISDKQLKKFREIRNDEGTTILNIFGELEEDTKPFTDIKVVKNVKLQLMKRQTVLKQAASQRKLSFALVCCAILTLLVST